ncbi:hypothetical protein VNO77_37801 [Canavalia gladiata]|uniref:Uncharacterized protein n=1 Tax=Canavalia gladiata TaxID=3824 RepID=A0AAN9PWU8_CANGL
MLIHVSFKNNRDDSSSLDIDPTNDVVQRDKAFPSLRSLDLHLQNGVKNIIFALVRNIHDAKRTCLIVDANLKTKEEFKDKKSSFSVLVNWVTDETSIKDGEMELMQYFIVKVEEGCPGSADDIAKAIHHLLK